MAGWRWEGLNQYQTAGWGLHSQHPCFLTQANTHAPNVAAAAMCSHPTPSNPLVALPCFHVSGGGLAWVMDMDVIPGTTYQGAVGAGGNGPAAGGNSWFVSTTTLLGQGGQPAPTRATGVVGATLGTYRGVGTAGAGGLPWSGGTAYNNRPGGGGGAAGYFVPGPGGACCSMCCKMQQVLHLMSSTACGCHMYHVYTPRHESWPRPGACCCASCIL